MATDRYLILSIPRVPEVDLELGVPLATPLVESVATAPEITVDSLREDEAQDIAEAPSTLGVVRADLPLRLIAPYAESPTAVPTRSMWGLEAVGALSTERKGRGVRLAVLDTGCNVDHEAFHRLRASDRIVSRNFTQEGAGPDDVSDTDGHGTHCAGTACGDSVAGQRIGVAPEVDRLIVGKILGRGGGTNETIVESILWAVKRGASIISLSVGIDFPGWVQALHANRKLPIPKATSMALKDYRDAILMFGKLSDFLRLKNVLIVAAAGNESERPAFTIDQSPPAASEHILSVAALDRTSGGFGAARFSNTGPDLSAPGVGIVSARHTGGTSTLSGTSMAAPHVAGVAALWAESLAEGGEVTHQELKARLIGSARRLPLHRRDVGAGLVQAPEI